MAGDWIKIEENTPDKPEVQKMASMLGIDSDAVTGKLIRVWAWASQNCNAEGVTDVTVKALLDRVTCVTGFAESMLHVGWLEQDGEELSFPNFDYHNSQTAKTRAKSNKRVSKHREEKRKCNGQSVTLPFQKALPEKRREEKNIISISPACEDEEILPYEKAGPDDPGSVVYPPCTKQDVDLYAGVTGIPDDVAQQWFERHEANDWRPYGKNPPFTTKSWKFDLKNYWKNLKAKQDEQRNRTNGAAKAGKVISNPRNRHLPEGEEERLRQVAEMEDIRDDLKVCTEYPEIVSKINRERIFERPEYEHAIKWIKSRNATKGAWNGVYDRLAESKIIDEQSGRWIADDC